MPRRTPPGVRGLKYQPMITDGIPVESHPARGAWIEINMSYHDLLNQYGRTPQGVRGLK